MALIFKSNAFFTSLMILVALFGVSARGTFHKFGDSSKWNIMGANYESWASSRTFQVGDSLVFEYNKEFHDVTEVTHNSFELCDPSKPLVKYQTGSDRISLTKLGFHNFICGVPDHCKMGQKLQIFVLPASLGPVAAHVLRSVRSPSTSSLPSPVNNGPRYQIGTLVFGSDSASTSTIWIEFSFVLALLSLLALTRFSIRATRGSFMKYPLLYDFIVQLY